MKIKVNLNETQYKTLLYCTNGKTKVPVNDMLKYFSEFLDKDLRNQKYTKNDIFVFTKCTWICHNFLVQ
jgi:hypothetical protein